MNKEIPHPYPCLQHTLLNKIKKKAISIQTNMGRGTPSPKKTKNKVGPSSPKDSLRKSSISDLNRVVVV